MDGKKSPPDKDIANLVPAELSEAEASDVRGGATGTQPTVSPTAPKLNPIAPRSINPCW